MIHEHQSRGFCIIDVLIYVYISLYLHIYEKNYARKYIIKTTRKKSIKICLLLWKLSVVWLFHSIFFFPLLRQLFLLRTATQFSTVYLIRKRKWRIENALRWTASRIFNFNLFTSFGRENEQSETLRENEENNYFVFGSIQSILRLQYLSERR